MGFFYDGKGLDVEFGSGRGDVWILHLGTKSIMLKHLVEFCMIMIIY